MGCIFYEMLVGTSPFKGTNEADLLMNIKTKELNVPKDVVLSKVSIEILIKVQLIGLFDVHVFTDSVADDSFSCWSGTPYVVPLCPSWWPCART